MAHICIRLTGSGTRNLKSRHNIGGYPLRCYRVLIDEEVLLLLPSRSRAHHRSSAGQLGENKKQFEHTSK